ncbi:hypothetical protein NQ314_008703 [Rhamnusium bicolor]|uniref:Uncharacterized protein n=1 Tax=Rhamnusium bicolor TaxID=1586634 RepID=A0AAV8Y6I8_9CUCU|nr:hypothetical protein NQ314_008703 [Rhamnusium bicolor]
MFRVVCRQRYRREGQKQRAQFIKEIKIHELLQRKALDGAKIHREFCKATRKPASHEIIKVTRSQLMKIENILKTEY